MELPPPPFLFTHLNKIKCIYYYRIIFLKLKEEDTQELKKKIEYVNFVI